MAEAKDVCLWEGSVSSLERDDLRERESTSRPRRKSQHREGVGRGTERHGGQNEVAPG